MISYSETKKFYETTPAWDDDIYGQFTPCYFTNFIKNELEPLIVSDSMESVVLPFFLRNLDVFQAKYEFVGKVHRSYLFSDKYVNRMLEKYRLEKLQSMRCNVLYEMMCWFVPERIMKKFYSKDLALSNHKFWRRFARNEIFIAKKVMSR